MTDNGFAVIYSASKGQKAADGPPGGNSPFTQQFLNALAYHGDELSDLFRRIGQEMGLTRLRDKLRFSKTPARSNSISTNQTTISGTELSRFWCSTHAGTIPSRKPLSPSRLTASTRGTPRFHQTSVRNFRSARRGGDRRNWRGHRRH